jgi:hypothetical protein
MKSDAHHIDDPNPLALLVIDFSEAQPPQALGRLPAKDKPNLHVPRLLYYV